MPPRANSRYYFCEGLDDDADETNFFLTEREPFRFRMLADTIKHVVKDGDTLFYLAHRYFHGFRRPAGLWWVIGDFQPIPILDPTLLLAAGLVLYIPSSRAITEEIFNEARRSEVAEDFI